MPVSCALQSRIAQAILGENGYELAPMLAKGSFDPLQRLNIYRNNTFASLTATLIAVFPVTLQLLGENYFRYVAGVFIRNNPPQEARLVRYGGSFARFLAGFEDIRRMPFIAETARLEWMISKTLDAPALPCCSLGQMGDEEDGLAIELLLQPSLRLLVCRWPALEIWSAHQADGNVEGLARLTRRPERIALWRSKESMHFLRLDACHFAFLHTLKRRNCLEVAVSRVLARAPDFDLAGALGGFFAEGLVTRIRHITPATH